jgi:hypothetical protein
MYLRYLSPNPDPAYYCHVSKILQIQVILECFLEKKRLIKGIPAMTRVAVLVHKKPEPMCPVYLAHDFPDYFLQ